MLQSPASAEIIAFEPPAGRAAWLAQRLRDRLWSGAYRPHQWIRESTLRSEFGLSNGPVREALQLLVAEGLLERVPYCGTRVAALDERELIELFQLRLALLEIAAELAALRRDPSTLAAALQVLEQVRRHGDELNRGEEPSPAPGHLMSWLIVAAGNRQLARDWERLAGRSRMYVSESARRAADPLELTRHAEALVAAVVAGNPGGARAAVRRLTEHQIKDLGLALLPSPGKEKSAKQQGAKQQRRRR